MSDSPNSEEDFIVISSDSTDFASVDTLFDDDNFSLASPEQLEDQLLNLMKQMSSEQHQMRTTMKYENDKLEIVKERFTNFLETIESQREEIQQLNELKEQLDMQLKNAKNKLEEYEQIEEDYHRLKNSADQTFVTNDRLTDEIRQIRSILSACRVCRSKLAAPEDTVDGNENKTVVDDGIQTENVVCTDTMTCTTPRVSIETANHKQVISFDVSTQASLNEDEISTNQSEVKLQQSPSLSMEMVPDSPLMSQSCSPEVFSSPNANEDTTPCEELSGSSASPAANQVYHLKLQLHSMLTRLNGEIELCCKLKKQNTNLRKQINEKDVALDEIKTDQRDQHNVRMAKLASEVDHLRKRCGELESEITSQQLTTSDLHETSDKKLNDLIAELDKKNTERADFKSQIAALQTAKMEIAEKSAKEINDLYAELQGRNNEINRMKEMLSVEQRKVVDVKHMSDERNRQLSFELENVEKKFGGISRENNQHRTLIKELTEMIDKKEDELRTMEDKYVSDLEAMRAHITDLECDQNRNVEHMNNKEQVSQRLQHQLRTAKDEVAAMTAQCDMYKTDFETERKQREQLAAEKESLVERLQFLEEELTSNNTRPLNMTLRHSRSSNSSPRVVEQYSATKCPGCRKDFPTEKEMLTHCQYCDKG